MDKKKLFIIIGILSALLILETGYLVGKHRGDETRGPHVPENSVSRRYDQPVKRARNTNRNNPMAIQSNVDDSLYDNPLGVARDKRYRWDEWDPFAEMQDMQTMMNRLFNNSFSRASRMNVFDAGSMLGSSFDPDIDIREQDDSYVLVVDLPGVDKDSIDIKVNPNSVTISGERQIEHEEKDDAKGYYRAERSFGSFSRTIPFQNRIIPGEVEADQTEGVLIVKLPKEKLGYEEEKGTKVKVK